jgi:NAD-dependent deacetylase
MKRIVILTGAGISKESGIETFRDGENSLWNNYDIKEVCTTAAYNTNREVVLNFYNERRKKLADVEPNQAHIDLVSLEDYYDVNIITQNVDDLHERAGSSNILHVHGELTKARSCMYETKSSPVDEVIKIGYNDINLGDVNEHGIQLRPHIVFFGDGILDFQKAKSLTRHADIFIIIGTSLGVYPIADLPRSVKRSSKIYIIDPNVPEGMIYGDNVTFIQEPATVGVAKLVSELIEKAIEDE